MSRFPDEPLKPRRPPVDRRAITHGPFASGAAEASTRPPTQPPHPTPDEAREHLRQLVAHFEDEWARGRRPWIDNYLAGSVLPRPAVLGALLPVDLSHRLDAGENVRVGDYLKRFPELDDDHAADLVFRDYCLRRQTGAPVAQAEYVRQFPWLKAGLASRFAASGFRDPAAPPAPVVALGGRFEFVELLGEGGMGQVWRVRHRNLGRDRAVKLIRPNIALNPETRERMIREARAMARICHHHAVTVHDVATEPVPYIEMEFVEGTTLDHVLKPGVPMPLDWTARVLDQLCDVLQVAHDHGIVHRDLKPTNLILVAGHPPGKEFLKVLDFGIAKFLGGGPETLTLTGHALGTVVYMSPEQVDNAASVDVTSDIYTVGVILYELLSGRRPFDTDGSLPRTCSDIVNRPAPPFRERNPAADAPRGVEELVLRCLEKSPRKRPQSARQLADDFRRLTGATPSAAVPLRRFGLELDRRRVVFGLSAVAVLVGLAGWYGLAGGVFRGRSRRVVPLPDRWTGSEENGAGLVEVDGRSYHRRIGRTLPGGLRAVAVLVPRSRPDDPETFYMLRDKVSVGLFAAFAAENPGAVTSTAWQAGDPRLPVMNVSGVTATAFAAWLGGDRAGLLPTPRQWMRAAAAPPADAYRQGPFAGTRGATRPPRVAVGNLTAPLPVDRDDTDDVSPTGCRDMSGNGFEWTRFDPTADAGKRKTVLLLGESFRDDSPFTFLKAKERPNHQFFDEASPEIGFRVVIELDHEAVPSPGTGSD